MDLKKLQDMMSQKVTRRDFLAYVGAVTVTLVGIKGLLKNLVSNNPHYKKQQAQVLGYGYSDYGNKSLTKHRQLLG